MVKKFPIHPKNPERICWGCDKYCPADSLACGNGSERTQHPVELFGEDGYEWGGILEGAERLCLESGYQLHIDDGAAVA